MQLLQLVWCVALLAAPSDGALLRNAPHVAKEVKADTELQALVQSKATPLDDVANKVAEEGRQNIHITDSFAAQAQDSEKKEKEVNADKELQAFVQQRATPLDDVAKKVAEEGRQNIHITDSFAAQAQDSDKKEKQVKADKELQALVQQGATPLDDVAKKVAEEGRQNIHITDSFAAQAQDSEQKEKRVKADKELQAFVQTAPDVAAKVAEEGRENIHIADSFAAQASDSEKKDKEVKADKELQALLQRSNGVIALDKDMKTEMLVQVKQEPAVHDSCAGIECAKELVCPGGFIAQAVPGHCCPYCINPNIQVKEKVVGAVGSHGGKQSSFCDDIWCFPTLCKTDEQQPTLENGQCCPICPE